MKTINLYLCKTILISLAVAIGISTFVLLIGQFYKVFELLTRGVPFQTLFLYITYRTPQALGFTIPLGVFIATILVFNQMSVENEISALRAAGVSLQQIIAPLIIFSLFLSGLCYFLQFKLAPEFKYEAKILVREEGVQNPLLLVDAGRFVEIFDGYIIYVGRKDKDSIWDIHLYVLDNSKAVRQKIYAQRGQLDVKKEFGRLDLTLHNTMIETVDPNHPEDVAKNRRIKGETLLFPLDYAGHLSKRRLTRVVSEMTLAQLFARIQIYSERGKNTAQFYLEIHQRAAMALSVFSFMLIGIPLGIRLPRKESHWGLITSFFIPFLYYTAIMFVGSMQNKPEYHPEFLMWVPNIICQIIGLSLLWMKR